MDTLDTQSDGCLVPGVDSADRSLVSRQYRHQNAKKLICARIAATFKTNDTQIKLMVAALIYDYTLQFVLLSPVADLLLGKKFRKHRGQKHTIKRFENFFTIALGEGVILLVRESPLGQGFTNQLGRGIFVFQIYYALNYLFYHADMSKRFVHALYRRWYIR